MQIDISLKDKLQELRQALPTYSKIALHTGLSGFNSPLVYGIYKKDVGGNPLGVHGKDFEPVNLQHYFDAVTTSLTESNFDLNTLEFKEYKGGKRISFDVASNDFEVKNSPLVGDVYKVKLSFTTSLDGSTKACLNFKTLRLVCLNGSKSYKNDLAISYKNTLGNQGKIMKFTNEIATLKLHVEDYQKQLERICQISYTTKQVNEFFKDLLGYSMEEYKDLHTKSRAILDSINACVAIEEQSLKMSPYTLLQGITRYCSHSLNKGEEGYLFGSGEQLIKKAHQLVLN